MSFKGNLVGIHGFLGSPADWKPVLPAKLNSTLIDLFSPDAENNFPDFSLSGIAKAINQIAQTKSEPRILAGYSLGGRIALHALLENPSLWAAAVIISAHPGLSDPKERESRLNADVKWAEKFEKENWDEVMAEWNKQPLFQGGVNEPKRKAKDYSKTALAESLRKCSLGVQDNLFAQIAQIKKPILWVVGENDPKFRALAEKIADENPFIHLIVVAQSGHRVLADQPAILNKILTDYLS